MQPLTYARNMRESLILNIPGEPIAWKRPAGRITRYDSQKKEKEAVRLHFIAQMRKQKAEYHRTELEGHHCAYKVSMLFYLGLNQSEPVGQKNAKLWGLSPANEKPDCDNLAKFYLDCGNGLLWSDDKRVVSLYVRKLYSENPRTIIEVMSNNNLSVPSSVDGVLRVFGPNKLKEFANHVKEFAYLSEDKIDCNLEGSPGGLGQQERWLAWTALLLVNFAKSHANDLKNILKYSDIDFQLKEMNLEVNHDQNKQNNRRET